MESHEIEQLSRELTIRGLKGAVKSAIQMKRRSCSGDTIARAFQVTDWDAATPLLQEILNTANSILEKDNERLASAELELVPATN